MNTGLLLFILIVAIVALGAFISLIPILRLKRAASAAGVKVSFSKIMGMKVRKTNPAIIVPLLIKAKRAGVEITSDMLETVVLSRGHARSVVEALIVAKEKDMPLEFRLAAAIDLSGGDPVEFVGKAAPPYTEQGLREAAREYLESSGVSKNIS